MSKKNNSAKDSCTKENRKSKGFIIPIKFVPLLITVSLFILMFTIGSVAFTGFFAPQVFLNLFIDNAFLCVTAIGMTFVIISGGIDLSVGSVIALSTMITASLVEKHGFSPAVVIPFVLLVGSSLGMLMGVIIHFFKVQPFIATLAGMFFARGMCYVISIDTIAIENPFYVWVSQYRIPILGESFISINVIIFFAIVIFAIFLAHYTKFGRTIYAIGGNEQSALLMGLPVGRTKVLIYTFSGFCSALAGVVFSFYMLSGYGLHALGLEMDAIASAVIGGTLLSGGVGYVFGTMFGVLVLGTIQVLIMFQGELSSWWTKIAIALLIFVFCLLQRMFEIRGGSKKTA
jgi:simple sugar transport system permease protein